MTMPLERTNAVNRVREFLRKLLVASETPRIPKSVRLEAKSLLKHYPSEYDLIRSAFKCPEVWGPKDEDKSRLMPAGAKE